MTSIRTILDSSSVHLDFFGLNLIFFRLDVVSYRILKLDFSLSSALVKVDNV